MQRGPEQPSEPDTELVRRITADRRRAAKRLVAATLLFACVAILWSAHKHRVRALANGEIDLSGTPRYEPPHPVDRHALGRIDFERVHGELVPAWTIALGRATTDSRRREADRAFEALAHELSPDQNLSALIASANRALRDDPIEHARRLDYVLWAYNHYLDQNEVPWRVEASLSLSGRRTVFRALSYEILADGRTPSGDRLRLLRRADRTNLVEGWLGHAPHEGEGALVIMGRVLHFTVRHVWPALHPALDERRPPAERPWLADVREEVRAALDSRTYALLSESAVDQQALIEVAESIEARHACGSRLRFDVPYNGLSERSRTALSRALARSREDTECPEVTLDEAARVVGASERLGSTNGLEDAVERLAMLVARSVAVHELQHVVDGAEPACPGCPAELHGLARAEVSAYLSALSHENLGYLALLQACATPRSDSIAGAALQAVIDALLPYGCEGPTLPDLYAWAELLEQRLFGERASIELPSDLPPRVTLLPRSPRALRSTPNWQSLDSGWGVALTSDFAEDVPTAH